MVLNNLHTVNSLMCNRKLLIVYNYRTLRHVITK